MANDLLDAARGVLLGTFIGDALGMPVEGMSRAQIAEKYGFLRNFVEGRLPAGTYTDDTEMAIGLAASLAQHGQFEAQDVAQQFAENFTLWRGYGSRTCGVMSKLRSGAPWQQVGTDSWGNGAAMRIAPLGFFYCGDPELKVVAEQSCRITHTHPNGVAGGVVQAVAVAAATRCGLLGLGKEKAEFCRLLVDTAAEYGEGLVRPLERLAELKLGDDVETKAATLATLYACDVSAVGSVPAAAAAFLCAEDFEDAVVTAVNAGGDTDTIGAMSGALAGAFFGAQAIGEDLLVGLDESEKGRAQVEELARRLAEKARGRAVGHFELDEALEEEEGPNEEEQP